MLLVGSFSGAQYKPQYFSNSKVDNALAEQAMYSHCMCNLWLFSRNLEKVLLGADEKGSIGHGG